MIQATKKYKRGVDDEHKMIWRLFVEWLYDIPYVILMIIIVITIIRLIPTIQDLMPNSNKRRDIIAYHVAQIIPDLFVMVCGTYCVILVLCSALLLLLAPWRIIIIKKRWNLTPTVEGKRELFLKNSFSMFIDYIAIAFALFSLLFIWRLPLIIYHIKNRTRLTTLFFVLLYCIAIDVVFVLAFAWSILCLSVVDFIKSAYRAGKVHGKRRDVLRYV